MSLDSEQQRVLELFEELYDRFGMDAVTAIFDEWLARHAIGGKDDALSAVETLAPTLPGRCAICGIPVAKKLRGRPRKYCPACVERLRHRTPILQSRKSGAENV